MPTCDACGAEVGNEGALKNHQGSEACKKRQREQQSVQAQGQPQGAQQAQPPATQQQAAQVPANRQEAPAAVKQGAQLGEMFAQATSDDPADKAEAQGSFLQMVGAAAARYGQTVQQRGQQRAERAAQSDLTRADAHYCPACGTAILDPPTGEMFTCHGCGEPLELAGEE